MKSKKSLGQHFLRSERALAKIIEVGQLTPQDTVLEIGPGQGILTEKLLETGSKVIAVEKDDELDKFLSQKFVREINSGRLDLIHEDILNFPTSNLQTYKLIANIPYNITGAILEKFLSTENQPERIVLLIQREVAKRIVGKPFDSAQGKESILSLSVKTYGTPHYIETVKAGSFVPMPKVDSAIISIEAISKDFFQNFGEKDFFRLLKTGFSSKRKKLSSNLSNVFDKGEVEETFKKLGLDKNTRAEDLGLKMWGELASSVL